MYCLLIQYVNVNIADSYLVWLMHWPAGLKLNSELCIFFGQLYRWMVMSWRRKDVLTQ